jgi:hypothetical protein
MNAFPILGSGDRNMPTRTAAKRNKSTSSSRRQLRKKPRRVPASHLLIIQCEPDKMTQQGLDFGNKVAAICSLPFHKKKIVIAKAYSKEELCRALGETLESHDRFRTILVVGHSDEHGLQLTPGNFYDWEVVGDWLKPFKPEFLLLMACRAGRSLGVRPLFQRVPSVRQVFASPVAFFSDQTHPLAGLLLALVKNRKVDESWLRALQVGGYLFKDALLYRWKRGETLRSGNVERAGWDLLGDLLDRRSIPLTHN